MNTDKATPVQAAFMARYPNALFHDTSGECVAHHAAKWIDFKDGWLAACNTGGLSLADALKLERYGAASLIRQKNASILAHQSVLADRDAEIATLKKCLLQAQNAAIDLAKQNGQLRAAAPRFESMSSYDGRGE